MLVLALEFSRGCAASVDSEALSQTSWHPCGVIGSTQSGASPRKWLGHSLKTEERKSDIQPGTDSIS